MDFMDAAENGLAKDAVIGLMALGYKRGHANQAIRELEATGELNGSIEAIIKKALTKL
jgi:Holliday junction resolvasome RuvABC DNA-binding subunit